MSGAFLKGGCGCLFTFIVLAILALILGGTVHADPIGIILLFVCGGCLGLLIRWIYKKGFDAGRRS